MTRILLTFVFIVLIFCAAEDLLNSQSCAPCKCSLSNEVQVKHADCSRETTIVDITDVPNNLDFQNSVSLKEQPLKNIEEEAFLAVNLEIVNLEKCKISNVHKNAFKNLRNLSDLNLAYNEIEVLDRDTFKWNKKLQIVRLNNNQLKTIDDGLFAGLTLLNKLYLNDNKISVIHRLAFATNINIKSLFLQNNQLSYINSRILENMTQLFQIYLDGNPWFCDCSLRTLHDDLLNRQFMQIYATCQEPEILRGLPLIDLSSEHFSCLLNAIWNENVTNVTSRDDTVTLSCVVEAFPEPTIKWMCGAHVIDPSQYNLKYQFKNSDNNMTYSYNLTIFNLTFADSEEYKCKIHNYEQEVEKSFILTVNPNRAPVIISPKVDRIVVDMYSENFTLDCVFSGNPRPDSIWFRNGYNHPEYANNIIRGSNLESDYYWVNLTFPTDMHLYQGYYICFANNSEGSIMKSVFLGIKIYPLKFIETAQNYKVTEVSNITMACGVQASSKPEFRWIYLSRQDTKTYENYSVDIVIGKHAKYWFNLTVLNVRLEDKGIYKCIVSNFQGNLSKTMWLKVNLKPPKIVKTKNYAKVTEKSNITLYCGVDIISRSEISWKHEDVLLDMQVRNETYSIDIVKDEYDIYWSELNIFNISADESGWYICTANNSEGLDTRGFRIKYVNTVDTSGDTSSILLYAGIGCGIFIILMVLFLLKCFMRYYELRNNNNEQLFEPIQEKK